MGQYVAAHVAEEHAGDFLDPDRDHAILERTGPGIWSDSVHNYLKQVWPGELAGHGTALHAIRLIQHERQLLSAWQIHAALQVLASCQLPLLLLLGHDEGSWTASLRHWQQSRCLLP